MSGDELLDAQDLIEVVKEKGGEVDKNGYITLYHRTSEENAEKIRSTGYMKGKEDGLFFSTAKEGYASGYGDTVVELSIPAEKLILDDIFASCNYSKSKLSKDFKKKYGETVFDMLTRIRLSNAKKQMEEDPTLKIKDVAMSCGFNDCSYFCRMYKRAFGKSPKIDNQ